MVANILFPREQPVKGRFALLWPVDNPIIQAQITKMSLLLSPTTMYEKVLSSQMS